ncbi:MAG: tRNA pseudouridine(55) synthase TruB [Eudoraea sp.]|nr:tRNA pseudouridine(55) synthase TruB [Eudoraea sp.]
MFSKDGFLDGEILLIDKPLEWTSFQVVNAIRWAIRKRYDLKKIKVGHAGTLDPLATGLLIVCTGKATKKIQEIQEQEKTYEGSLVLGKTTPSYDLETEVDNEYPVDHITETAIKNAATYFVGNIMQKPPIFSAIRKEGKRLYEFARKGEKVEIPERHVYIRELEITGFQLPEVHFRVVCSKGTYIRSLAHDMGKALGSGAYLSALRRTKIGPYNVDNAWLPQKFKEALAGGAENTG